MTFRRVRWLALALTLAAADGAAAQTIGGRVLDAGDGRMLPQASIQVLAMGADSVLASAVAPEGSFGILMQSPGTYRLRVEVLGYTPLITDPVTVGPNEVITLELRLLGDAIALDPLRVVATRVEPVFMNDVRRRARPGFGTLITRDQLDERSGSRLEDVLMDAGARVSYRPLRGTGGPAVPMIVARNSGLRACYAAVYLNGFAVFTAERTDEDALYRLQELFSSVRPTDVEAIEMYRGAAQVPAEFSGSTAECGAVAIWMRSGYEQRAEEVLPPPPPARISLGAAGSFYDISGFHAPDGGLALEIATSIVTTRHLGVLLYGRYGSYTLGAASTSFLASDPEGTATVVGAQPLSLLTVGVEPRVTLVPHWRARPVVGVRAQLMRRGLSLGSPDPANPALGDHASNGWGLGVVGGFDIDVSRRFRAELSVAREKVRLREYPHLELWNRSTAAKWSATALRLGLGLRL